jgi:amino acid permease
VSTLVRPQHLAHLSSVGLLATVSLVGSILLVLASGTAVEEGSECPSVDVATPPASADARDRKEYFAFNRKSRIPSTRLVFCEPRCILAAVFAFMDRYAQFLKLDHRLPRFAASDFGTALGVVLFCFSGHAMFPELYAKMAASEQHRFGEAIDMGFLFAGMIYLFFAAAGYAAYGTCATDSITVNMMASYPSVGRFATVSILISTFSVIPIQSLVSLRMLADMRDATRPAKRPAAADETQLTSAHETLSTALDVLEVSELRRLLTLTFITPSAGRIASRVALMALAGLVAVSIPNFGACLAFIGAVNTMLISLILPAFFWTCVQQHHLSADQAVLCAAMIAIGFMGMFYGLRGAIRLSETSS